MCVSSLAHPHSTLLVNATEGLKNLSFLYGVSPFGPPKGFAPAFNLPLKGIVHNFFLLFKSHILDSNGVWYS